MTQHTVIPIKKSHNTKRVLLIVSIVVVGLGAAMTAWLMAENAESHKDCLSITPSGQCYTQQMKDEDQQREKVCGDSIGCKIVR